LNRCFGRPKQADSPHIHVTIPGKRRGGKLDNDTKVHRVEGFGKQLTTLRLPYRVTTVAQTVADCSGGLDARWIGAMVDSALVQRRAYLNPIISTFLGQPPERPGMSRLGEVLRRRVGMDVLPQSVLESMALELIKRLPVTLALQHPIVLPNGKTIHVDFAFPDHKLALEFDGYENHADEWAFRNDRSRDVDSFIADGWNTLRFTWNDVNHCPDYTLKRISDALAQAEAIRRARSSA
jgi:very-short-patch-repair endonuclease